jgi:pimeloyl-ACP methyl ester carboxylesterase
MKSHKITGGGGIQLHLVETGNSNGRPIMFIHGLSQCWLTWSRQINSDLAADFRLVAMDMRGHGLSDKPREGYADSRLWADDVHAAIQVLRLDHPILCGWSMGHSSSSTMSGTTARMALAGLTLSGTSQSSAVTRRCRFSLLGFSASCQVSFLRKQKRACAALRPSYACASRKNSQSRTGTLCWGIACPFSLMFARRCCLVPLTMMTFFPGFASPY